MQWVRYLCWNWRIGNFGTSAIIARYMRDCNAMTIINNRYRVVQAKRRSSSISIQWYALSQDTMGMWKHTYKHSYTRIHTCICRSVSVRRGALLYSLPIGANISLSAFYAYESYDYNVSPTSDWNYAIKVCMYVCVITSTHWSWPDWLIDGPQCIHDVQPARLHSRQQPLQPNKYALLLLLLLL